MKEKAITQDFPNALSSHFCENLRHLMPESIPNKE